MSIAILQKIKEELLTHVDEPVAIYCKNKEAAVLFTTILHQYVDDVVELEATELEQALDAAQTRGCLSIVLDEKVRSKEICQRCFKKGLRPVFPFACLHHDEMDEHLPDLVKLASSSHLNRLL